MSFNEVFDEAWRHARAAGLARIPNDRDASYPTQTELRDYLLDAVPGARTAYAAVQRENSERPGTDAAQRPVTGSRVQAAMKDGPKLG